MAEVASRPEFKDTKFFLVIDEINRANLATVFGELIYGLEYRGKSVATPYTVENSNKVVLPDNLYILGTMNTADKSMVALITLFVDDSCFSPCFLIKRSS